MTIRPRLHPNGRGFITTFRHPLMDGETKTFGLGTRDPVTAEAVCHDAEALFSNEPLLQDPMPDKLRGYERRAAEIVLGEERAAALLDQHQAVLTDDEARRVAEVVANRETYEEARREVARLRGCQHVTGNAGVLQFVVEPKPLSGGLVRKDHLRSARRLAAALQAVLAKSFGFRSYTDHDGGTLKTVEQYADTVIAVLSGHLHLTGVVERKGVRHISIAGTASYPCDYALYAVYPDRIEVSVRQLPAELVTPKTNIDGQPRYKSDYVDEDHRTPEEYVSGKADERSFTIPLSGGRMPAVSGAAPRRRGK